MTKPAIMIFAPIALAWIFGVGLTALSLGYTDFSTEMRVSYVVALVITVVLLMWTTKDLFTVLVTKGRQTDTSSSKNDPTQQSSRP